MSLLDLVDSYITDGVYKNAGKSGYYRHLQERIAFYVTQADAGTLDPARVYGYDRVVAERVRLLYKPAVVETVEESTATDLATAVAGPAKLLEFYGEEASDEEFLVWAGNEPLQCPTMVTYYDEHSNAVLDSLHGVVKQDFVAYDDSYIAFNADQSTPVGCRNRIMVFGSNQIAMLKASEKRYLVTNKNDGFRLCTPAVGNADAFVPSVDVDLSPWLNATTIAGKMTLLDDRYTVIHLYDCRNEHQRRFLLEPPYTFMESTGMGFTVDCSLLIVDNLLSAGTNVPVVVKLGPKEQGPLQDKTEVYTGWTDFVVSDDRLFAVRSEHVVSRQFTGFKLGLNEKSRQYAKSGLVHHDLLSVSYAIYEIRCDAWTDAGPTLDKLYDVTPPEVVDKHGVTGGFAAFSWAKLAWSSLNPRTFYVQLGYELVLQLPFLGPGFLYNETSTGYKYRTDSAYRAEVDDPTTRPDPLDDAWRVPMGITQGNVYRVVGQYYLEVSPSSTGLLLYETLGEMHVGFTPISDAWSCVPQTWTCPGSYYPWDWYGQRSDGLVVLLNYHALANDTVSVAYNMHINDYWHPMVVKLGYNAGKAPRWCTFDLPDDEKSYFPLRLAFANRGGMDYTLGGSTGISTYGGFNPIARTFAVTYAGSVIPTDGVHSPHTARPVLIAIGLSMYIKLWGNSVWANGSTSVMGPLMIETLPYQTVHGGLPQIFVNCNIVGAPTVCKNAYTKYLGYRSQYLVEGLLGTYGEVWGMLPFVTSGWYYKLSANGLYVTGRFTEYCFGDMMVDPTDPRKLLYSAMVYRKDTLSGIVLEDAHYLFNVFFRFDPLDVSDAGRSGVTVKLTDSMWFCFETARRVTLFWGPCLVDRV
jgi:hypothetical protein